MASLNPFSTQTTFINLISLYTGSRFTQNLNAGSSIMWPFTQGNKPNRYAPHYVHNSSQGVTYPRLPYIGYPLRRESFFRMSPLHTPVSEPVLFPTQNTATNVDKCSEHEEKSTSPQRETPHLPSRHWRREHIDDRSPSSHLSPSHSPPPPNQEILGPMLSTPVLGPLREDGALSPVSSLLLPPPPPLISPSSRDQNTDSFQFMQWEDACDNLPGLGTPTEEEILAFEEMRRREKAERARRRKAIEGEGRKEGGRSPSLSSSSGFSCFSDLENVSESEKAEEEWIVLDRQMELLRKQRDLLNELMEGVGKLQNRLWDRIMKTRRRAW